MIYLYLFGTCFHFIYVFMIIWNINTVRNQPEVSVLKPEWIAYLVLDYGISADWILTGRGGMFKQ